MIFLCAVHITLFVFGEILSQQNLVSRKCSTFLKLIKNLTLNEIYSVFVLWRCEMYLQARAGAVSPILMQELHVFLSHTFITLHICLLFYRDTLWQKIRNNSKLETGIQRRFYWFCISGICVLIFILNWKKNRGAVEKVCLCKIVKLRVLSHVLAKSYTSLRKVKRGPWDGVCNGLIHPPPNHRLPTHQKTFF